MPLDESPFADWSAHLFVADRTQYVLLSNTKSIYPTVKYGKGITNEYQFSAFAKDQLTKLHYFNTRYL